MTTPELPEGESSAVAVAPWVTEEELRPYFEASNIADIDPGFAAAVATDLLYTVSGRQYKSGRSVVRPSTIQSAYGTQSYLYPYSSMSGYGAAWGFAAGWSWTAIGMGWWQSGQDLSEVLLEGPVRRLNRVLVDGQDLGPFPPFNSNYQLFDKRRLIRTTDGTGQNSGAWPWNQSLQLPPTMPGTWLIDYEWGKNVPPSGKAACISLALEVARALTDEPSKLPARVLQVAAEGMSAAVADSIAYIERELMGVPLVDLFLMAKNPAKLRRRSVFLAPNTVQTRKQQSFP